MPAHTLADAARCSVVSKLFLGIIFLIAPFVVLLRARSVVLLLPKLIPLVTGLIQLLRLPCQGSGNACGAVEVQLEAELPVNVHLLVLMKLTSPSILIGGNLKTPSVNGTTITLLSMPATISPPLLILARLRTLFPLSPFPLEVIF